MNSAEQIKTCIKCGAQLSPRTLEGLCPACTARLTFDLPAESSTNATNGVGFHFGDYELMEEIGRGGMGVVYKARQRSLDRIVALKMILAGRFASSADVERFKAEAQAAAALQHSGIVAIHQIGEVDGRHYFTMDFIQGRSLGQMIADARFSIFDFGGAARWTKAIAEAIQCAHEHGVLHRDLKPSNVLIDEHGQPHITDFGLAKRLNDESDLTLSGKAIGSPSFMPPEQAVGKRNAIGPHSDVYAIGALLYYLLTGRAPFAAETLEMTLSQVLQNDPVPPRVLNSSVPRDLETICLKCLEKEPSRRYQTAQQLVDELGRFTSDEPILARPVSAPERTWRWCRRRPAVAGLVAALAASLIAGFVAVLWQWQRAEDHAQAETQERRRAEALVEGLELDRVDELLRSDQPAAALARLARVLRRNSTNHIEAEKLMAVLVQHDFAFPLMPPFEHHALVTAAELSPDGKLIVTASQDGTARLWDAASGQPVGSPMRHTAAIRSARFSRAGDKVVTASADQTARIWDARNGEPLAEPIQHRTGVNSAEFRANGTDILTVCNDGVRVWRVAKGQPERRLRTWKRPGTMSSAHFSPDGALVVTVNAGSVTVWRMDTGEPTSKPLAHPRPVRVARFSPDSRWLATGCEDGTAYIWDIAKGEKRFPPLRHDNSQYVEAVSYSPDGRFLVSAGRDRMARLWDAATGQPAGAPLQHTTVPTAAQFSADGKRLVTAAADNAAYVWDVASGKLIVELIRHPSRVIVATFSPDGQRLVTAAGSKIQIWDLRPAALEAATLPHRGVRNVRFNREGTRVLTAGYDGTARLWNARTGKTLFPSMTHSNWVMNARFSPDEQKILTAGLDGVIAVWDATTGREIFPRLIQGSAVREACFSPDGRLLAAVSDNGMLRLWSAESGQPVGKPMQHGIRLWHVDFSPDGQRVVTARSDQIDHTNHSARIWNVRTGQAIGKLLQHSDSVIVARFSPDGRKVVTASSDQTAAVWDGLTGEPLGERLRHFANLRDALFSPNGKLIATASMDNTARLWETATSRPFTEPLRHEAEVNSVQFSPDGRRLLTASYDGTARVWDCATGRPACEPLRHEGRVVFATFSADGQWIATASGDGTARLWEVPMFNGSPPGWLPDLAEAIAGQRFNATGVVEPVDDSLFWKLKAHLNSAARTDAYTRWAQWILADRTTRAASPSLSETKLAP